MRREPAFRDQAKLVFLNGGGDAHLFGEHAYDVFLERFAVGFEELEGDLYESAQLEAQLVGDYGLEKPEGLAAEHIRVGGAGGGKAYGHAAYDGVYLVGDGKDRAGKRFGKIVAGAPGLVHLLDGDGLGGARLVNALGVDPAHDALKFRELEDHGGGKIGSGDEGGFGGDLRGLLLPRHFSQLRGDAGHSFRLGIVGADVLLEDHGLQPLPAFFQGDFLVLVEEEAGVRQSR